MNQEMLSYSFLFSSLGDNNRRLIQQPYYQSASIDQLNLKEPHIRTNSDCCLKIQRTANAFIEVSSITIQTMQLLVVLLLISCSEAAPSKISVGKRAISQTYMGCYYDVQHLSMDIAPPTYDEAMTIETCADTCASEMDSSSVSYFGLQFGDACFCGLNLETYIPVEEDFCTWPCMGDQSQICGGMTEISIYKLVKSSGGVRGDPHVRTFDGRRYSYQGLCWHTLFKDCTNPSPAFEVRAKFETPNGSLSDRLRTRTVSINITVGDEYAIVDRLHVVTGDTGLVSKPRRIQIEEDGKMVVFSFKSHNTTFTLEWTLYRHVFDASFVGSDYNGKLCGLLGNADGDRRNDFVKPDGTLAIGVDEFGESWKVHGITCA
uniref:IgGFc-binding protein-like n=1 Tax=Saccoglossus kowalevskii TaxID=10224 RepID=A0ABM0GZI3_SACKO|nr:PREDICTED: IgGFc-binding protein-like [Saccoglossus kowalevskii]